MRRLSSAALRRMTPLVQAALLVLVLQGAHTADHLISHPAHGVGAPLDLAPTLAALGLSEMVDENMSNAARVHAIECGKDARGRVLIAFGGAAPLHAARVAEKLGMDRILVPTSAGVGSAVGFLRAPIAYEIVRSRLQKLSSNRQIVDSTPALGSSVF